ncbi:MAG: hypothetical protein R3F34_06560 [Planctomycetota bacterium]
MSATTGATSATRADDGSARCVVVFASLVLVGLFDALRSPVQVLHASVVDRLDVDAATYALLAKTIAALTLAAMLAARGLRPSRLEAGVGAFVAAMQTVQSAVVLASVVRGEVATIGGASGLLGASGLALLWSWFVAVRLRAASRSARPPLRPRPTS